MESVGPGSGHCIIASDGTERWKGKVANLEKRLLRFIAQPVKMPSYTLMRKFLDYQLPPAKEVCHSVQEEGVGNITYIMG